MIDCRNNEEHRRCITACLVKGTYILESEHQIRRKEEGKGKFAAAWWENFHFRLHHVLQSECNCVCCKIRRRLELSDQSTIRSFVYGAIFEYVPPDDVKNRRRHPSAPRFVVAFRGTMPRDATAVGDMRLNLMVLLNRQRFCSRFTEARKHVISLLSSIPPPPPAAAGGSGGRAVAGGGTANSNSVGVWLAGHSLGASIALYVGRDMVTTRGCSLPTFLFNPPHVSAAPLIDAAVMSSEAAKMYLYMSSYVIKCVLGMTFLKSHRKDMEKLFEQLSPWVPNLYVHRKDIICKGFIDYFEQREKAKELSTRVGNSAATLSYRDMVYSVFNKHSGRQHLLPCAVLWISHGDNPHALRQWWRPTGPEQDLRRQEYSWTLR